MPEPSRSRIPLLVVAGPTASGKTALAVELALRLNGEVVSADSMQVYRDLSIGTARPTEEECRGVPYHLTGFLLLEESYSVARYVEDARKILADIHRRGKLPILCGGTGLYIQSLLDNLEFTQQETDPVLRESLRRRIREEGGRALLGELNTVDPETAARLHENDHSRIVRALEVYRTTGIPISEQARLARRTPSPYDACLLVLDSRDRQILYERIHRRTDRMLETGLVDEARRVLGSPHAATVTQAIGYKELAPYLSGACTLESAADALKQGTRRYAKRQLSWFRHMRGTQFLYIDDYADAAGLADAATGLWDAFLTVRRREETA